MFLTSLHLSEPRYVFAGIQDVNAGMETFFGVLRRTDLLHNWYNSAEVFEKTIKEYTESFSLKRPSQKL